MKPWRGIIWAGALALWGAGALPAQAAWDNVFQVCCHHYGQQSASYYTPDPCNPCPQPVCCTRYVQRCYYQPVTCYQTKTYYDPVTTYRTSYYYEPVTSYRYSYYYDPCTCTCRQVACPTTCYQLRSQCCPVQSWVQRCCRVPVTTYQAYSVWEAVTSCSYPQQPACPPVAVQPQATLQPQGTLQPQTPYPQPGVTEQRLAPVPGVQEYRNPGPSNGLGYDRPYQQGYRPNGTSLQAIPRQPVTPPAPAPATAPPKVKLENIVAVPVEPVPTQVVRNDKVKDNSTAR
jgi:hypothetical protein